MKTFEEIKIMRDVLDTHASTEKEEILKMAIEQKRDLLDWVMSESEIGAKEIDYLQHLKDYMNFMIDFAEKNFAKDPLHKVACACKAEELRLLINKIESEA